MSLPDLEERLWILRELCRNRRLAGNVDFVLVARCTEGKSESDLAQLVDQTQLNAARREPVITQHDFQMAMRDAGIIPYPPASSSGS